MKSEIVSIILAILLCTSIAPAHAENTTIVFSTEAWKDATNKDGTGLYWDIFRAVYEPEGYKIEPKIRSYEGSINLLKHKQVDVMVGAYINEIESVVYPLNHFAVDIVQVIYKKDSKHPWNGIETINKKIVGWIKGYSFDEYLPEDIIKKSPIKRIQNRAAAFRLLNENRIDYFMDAMGDLSDFLNARISHNSEDYIRQTILELKLYLVFTDDDKGSKLANIFDKRFSLLLTKGEIRKLYDKYKASNMTYPSDF